MRRTWLFIAFGILIAQIARAQGLPNVEQREFDDGSLPDHADLQAALQDEAHGSPNTSKSDKLLFSEDASIRPASRPGWPTYMLHQIERAKRQRILAAVVRIRSNQEVVCTGTLVRHQAVVGVLTAAHCLYSLKRDLTWDSRTPLASLDIEHVPQPVHPATDAELAKAFHDCVSSGLPSYRDCIEKGAPDVAFLRISTYNATLSTPWEICSDPGNWIEGTIFGHGLVSTSGATASKVMHGAFRFSESRDWRGFWEAEAHGSTRTWLGDSGAPAIDARADHALQHGQVPQVCFVAAARNGERALVQPVWGLRDILYPTPMGAQAPEEPQQ